jgi:hypothetical protein
MKFVRVTFLLGLALAVAAPALAQAPIPRQDAIWARRSAGPITLNGILSEPAWAKAESINVRMGVDAGIPGSGWKYEGGMLPNDPTDATLKFLVVGNQLYLGARFRDKSIGGDSIWQRFDGILMGLKDHADPAAPKPPAEYFYAWWYPTPQTTSQAPAFLGRWGSTPAGAPRTPEQIAAWDAVTVVHGTVNTDAGAPDTDWTVEMRFNLTPMGYDTSKPTGEIIEWNVSVYDCDWWWPLDNLHFASNRVWYQSPWGNAAWYDEVHIFTRPDVTTSSTVLPALRPELYVPNGAAYPVPTIDGNLSDAAWAHAYSFQIQYGNAALRQTYPGVGPYRSGEFQPTVNGGKAFVADPNLATVKVFYRDNKLFMGFDVADQVVQYAASVDRWDGFIVSINDRGVRDPLDNVLKPRRLSFQVGPAGTALAQDYLLTMVGASAASVALTLKPGTTVDTLGTQADTGYTAEMSLDLTQLGYPSGLGDRALFLGVDHLDGDSFTPYTDSYGTRAWWFREYEGQCCPVWAHLADSPPTDSGEPRDETLDGYVLLGSYPNPSRQSSIRYSLAKPSQVMLEVYDVAGKRVVQQTLGVQQSGMREAALDGRGWASGVYFYRLNVVDPESGALRTTLSGRALVMR